MAYHDIVEFSCPECGLSLRKTSIAAMCDNEIFTSDGVPVIIAHDLEGKQLECPHCGIEYVINCPQPTFVKLVLNKMLTNP